MKLSSLLMLLFCMNLSAGIHAQEAKFSVAVENSNIREIIRIIKQQSDYTFVYNVEELDHIGSITMNVKDSDVRTILDACLKNSGYTYSILDKVIVIRKAEPQQQEQIKKIRGTITDKKKVPLPGVTVLIKGTTTGVATDMNGNFEIIQPKDSNITLIISFIGMKTQIIPYKGQNLTIVMEEDSQEMEEIVVTGAFTRKANTFTGSVVTVKGEELRRVGNQNVLQSLKNIDPSFLQIENLAMGSNPNALPDFQMRGGSTISSIQGEYASSANQPLFILDGFETELTKILDLDMNLVESLTTLKDATAKAIYGAKAANGVIVIETRKPEPGRLRMSYNGNLNIEAPDLSSYDLCNAIEKLEVERMAGLFSSENAENQISLDRTYTNKLQEILSGVNTDWKAQPTRVGIGHKHTLYFEGGDKAMLYGVELSYNKINGVMKGSNRTTFSGGITLSYRYKILTFRNKLSIDYNESNESPWGTFDQYCQMNPYSRLYDANGNLIKSYSYTNSAGNIGPFYNPIFNTTLNVIDNSTYTNITNNFYLECLLRQNLRLTELGRASCRERV